MEDKINNLRTILFYSLFSVFTSSHITYLAERIGLYGGLFNTTAITQNFQIFILIISTLILLLLCITVTV